MTAPFRRLDLSAGRGRVLAIGDVHGHFRALIRALDAIGYDSSRDVLVLLGDIVNRGPQSHMADLWFDHPRVLGNHEDGISSMKREIAANPHGSLAWLTKVGDETARSAFVTRLGQAPVLLEIRTPSGNTVGFAHAAVPFMDWRDAAEIISDPTHAQHAAARRHALTSREHAMGVHDATHGRVANIDHVFLGHTPRQHPVTWMNTTLVDTSRNKDHPVTVIDVDEIISAHR